MSATSKIQNLRPLHQGDATILVGALAFGVALVRLAAGSGLLPDASHGLATPGAGLIASLYPSGGIVLGVLSLTAMVLSRREPRPATQGPGTLACALAMVAGVMALLDFGVAWTVARGNASTAPWLLFQRPMGRLLHWSGTTILGAWFALALTGRGRPGPDWLDRLGCLIGLGWVILHLLVNLTFDLQILFI